MKIAVTYEEGKIFQHFGRTEAFKIFDLEENRIRTEEIIATNGTGHGALAGFLKEQGVEALICGGIGGGAQAALEQAGIRLYGGVSGDADEAVRAFLDGTLSYDSNVHCDHHDHHDHHGDGEHGCGHGEHGCGGSCA